MVALVDPQALGVEVGDSVPDELELAETDDDADSEPDTDIVTVSVGELLSVGE
jgi:hypothetical protein